MIREYQYNDRILISTGYREFTVCQVKKVLDTNYLLVRMPDGEYVKIDRVRVQKNFGQP